MIRELFAETACEGQAVTGLTAGTTYYYRVRAVNASGTSSNSSTITQITVTSIRITYRKGS